MEDPLLERPRHPHDPLTAEVALELPQDRGDRKARERDAEVGIEPFDRLDQTDQRDLLQVVERFSPTAVTTRQCARQIAVLQDERLSVHPQEGLPIRVLRKPAAMEFILWLIAVVLVVAGIVSVIRGALSYGIVLVVLGLLIGPGGVSLFA